MLKRDDRSALDKLRFSTAMLWQLLLSLQQATLPAAVGCTLLAIGLALQHAWRDGAAALAGASVLATALALPLMLWTPRPRDGAPAARWARVYAAGRDAIATLSMVLMAATVARVLPPAAVAVLCVPTVALAALPAFSGRADARRTLRHVGEFVMLNGVLHLLLWAYALARLHDTSWGTKGLVAAAPQAIGRSMRRIRDRSVLVVLGLNAALVGAALALPSLWPAPSNAVAEGFGLVNTLVLLMTLGGALRMARARRAGRAAARAEPAAPAALPTPTPRALDAA